MDFHSSLNLTDYVVVVGYIAILLSLGFWVSLNRKHTREIFLADHYFPRVKQIVDAYHEHDMKVFYHSEGNLWPVLDDLAATGIDGLNPCEPHSHMDVKEIRAQYPDLVLWGGVDNSYMLVYDSPEQVQQRVEELKVFGRDGGLLIGSTGQVHPACKLDNLITMIETVHGHAIV